MSVAFRGHANEAVQCLKYINSLTGNLPNCLTLSSPVVSNGYISKCSGPYWSNPPFGRSGLSARVPGCQKIKNGGLDQYDAERFGRLIFATIRKSVGLKGLNCNRAEKFPHLEEYQCFYSILRVQ